MKKVRLGDICLINMGQSPESSSYNKVGDGLPFFQGNADFGELYPTVRVWCNAPTKIATKDDILISVRAPIGALNISNTKCCIGRGLAALTVKQELCFTKYLWYAISSKIDYFESKGTGSTFKAINRNILEDTEFELPDKIDQQRITFILDRVCDLIMLRKQQLTVLDDLIKSRFVEMFGDPISNPKGWEKRNLADEAEIKIGPFGSLLHKDDYITGGHPLVNPSHIINGQIAIDNNLTISDDKYVELSAYHLIKGDVVLGRRGEMGRCAVVEQSGLLCGTGSLLIRSKGDLNADFIQKIISYPTFKRSIEDMAVGQTMLNLNVPIVSSFKIIKPPANVQNQYYSLVAQVNKTKSAIQKSLEETQLLFDSLMQTYFG